MRASIADSFFSGRVGLHVFKHDTVVTCEAVIMQVSH